jgi:pre-mRNA-splicing factor CWC22
VTGEKSKVCCCPFQFPNIGELLLKRLILNFKRGFKRNDKIRCTSSVKFIAHMVNQQVS